ncbi:MAG TPA: bifunctional glutamate N-acetyltransferase/amino-acid acetyltransferase ArgJ [Polyangiaceae bacterium]|nr:bifunctional glutamate N-acetyltransferase/amino-acid acetyltransferase ArgJ [Polyangiaceae bacterium]
MKTPRGFSYSGLNCGIKTARKDLALVFSEVPCAVAGCFTVNASRAAPVIDASARVPAEGMRAIVANSGNANALAGPQGVSDVRKVCAAVADALGVPPDTVVSASTGVIGVPLPVPKLVQAAPRLASTRGQAIAQAAEAIWTTDTRVKLAHRTLTIGGVEATFAAFAKGAGMIAPEMATVLAFITTDLRVNAKTLQAALRKAMKTSFEMLTVDGDMSTNDAVFAMANGLAANPPIHQNASEFGALVSVLEGLCVDLARQIAEDGDGATKIIEVRVGGAPDANIARDLARTVAGSNLVKAAIFGADPNWGRVLASVGARVGSRKWPIDPTRAIVHVQGTCVYDGAPTGADPPALRAKMRDPQVLLEVRLAEGDACATAWGCDLTYDFVKINADYTSLTHATADGTIARDDRLTNYSPAFKRALLVEALSYIARFSNTRAVVKYGGVAMQRDSLKTSFANDINLLRNAGLLPIVVHGGGSQIEATMESLGHVVEIVDGVPVTDRDDVRIVEMVVTGRVNTEIVSLLNQQSAHAVGVSGKDGGLLRARKLVSEDGRDLGLVGEVTHVNHELLDMLLEKKYVPVVSSVGLGEDGEGYNINADAAAAEIAIAVRAEKLIFMTDFPGILENGELVSEMSASELQARLLRGTIEPSMVFKARSALRAIQGGVARVHILDGRTPHSVIAELFTDRGVGTLVHKD